MANLSIPDYDNIMMEQMPVHMILDHSLEGMPGTGSPQCSRSINMSNLSNESMPAMVSGGRQCARSMDMNMSNLLEESMPAMVSNRSNRSLNMSRLSNESAPAMVSNRSCRSNLMDESMPPLTSTRYNPPSMNGSNLFDESAPSMISSNRSGCGRNTSNLIDESMPSMAADPSQLQSQLRELEHLISTEQRSSQGGSCSPAASIVVNETKTVGQVGRNECGEIVPTAMTGTITTTTTTYQPDSPAKVCQVQRIESMDLLDDEAEPSFHEFSRELDRSCALDASAQRRAELEARLASMSVRFPDVGDVDDLLNESEFSCDRIPELPADMCHVGVEELFQDVPSDDRALIIANAYIMDRIAETDQVEYLINRDNFYDRRLMIVIQTRMEEAIRSAQGLFNSQYGSPDFPLNKFINFIRFAVLDEVRNMRFDQVQMQRRAAGAEPLVPFGPCQEHEYHEPIGPRNWTEEDVYGPWPEHMAVHVYEEPEYWGPHPENRCVYVAEEEEVEQLPVYGPELMYGPWEEEYYEVPAQGRTVKRRSASRGLKPPSSSGLRPPTVRHSEGAATLQVPTITQQGGLRPPSSGGLRAPSVRQSTGTCQAVLQVPTVEVVPKARTSGLRPPSSSGLRPPSSGGMRPPSGSPARSSGSGLRPPSTTQQRLSRPAEPTAGPSGTTCPASGLQQQAARVNSSRLQPPKDRKNVGERRPSGGACDQGNTSRRG